MAEPPTRAVLLEAMSRAHCRCNLECDPDESDSLGRPIWMLFTTDMAPLLDAVIATSASLASVTLLLARIGRAA